MYCYFLDIFPVSYHLVWEEIACLFLFCWYLCSSILRNSFPSKNYYAKFAKFKENSPLIKSYRTKYIHLPMDICSYKTISIFVEVLSSNCSSKTLSIFVQSSTLKPKTLRFGLNCHMIPYQNFQYLCAFFSLVLLHWYCNVSSRY